MTDGLGRIDTAVIAAASVSPDAVAVRDETESLSYRSLVAHADALASKLDEMSAGVSGVVGVHMRRSPWAVVAMLGVLRAGHAYLPIDPQLPSRRKQLLLDDSRALAVVGEESVDGADTSFVPLQRAISASVHRTAGRASGADLIYVLYTSGSTGTPKGVAIEHRSVANLARWHCERFGVGPGARVSQFAPLSFDASVWEIWPCLAAGATLELVPDAVRAFPAAIAAWLGTHDIDVCFLPTAVAESALEHLPDRASDLRWLLTGGDRLRTFRPEWLRCGFVNAYGPTEATVLATAGDVPTQAQAVTVEPTLGWPIPNVTVHVLDDDQGPVGMGDVGEVCIGGAGVARGYAGANADAAERFVTVDGARLYRTGDLGRLLPTGELQFEGRADEQVKVRGQRIELGEVEAATRRSAGVRDAAAVVANDGSSVDVFVVIDVGGPTPTAIRADVAQLLPRFMVPRIRIVDGLPITERGKLDRQRLRIMISDGDAGPSA